MNWRAKLWFFNSGSSTVLAVLLATAGNAFCFAFALLAAIYWQIGNTVIVAGKKEE